MISIMMKNMYGTNDYAPIGLMDRVYHTPRDTHGANDLRTIGARRLEIMNWLFIISISMWETGVV